MDKKKSIIIMAVLGVLIVALTIVVVLGGNRKKNKVNDTTEAEATTVEEVTDNNVEDKEEKQEDNKEKQVEGGVVTVSKPNTWEGDGRFWGQIDVTVTNNSGNEIKDWKVVLSAEGDVKVDSFWNGDFKKDGNTIVVTAVDYNQSILANSNIKDIGVIVSATNKEEFDKIGSEAKLFVGGKEVSGNVDTTTEEATTEATKDDNTEEITEEASKTESDGSTPVEIHGKLSVKGTDLVDEHGNKVQLKGISTHGLAWFPDYVNKDAFATFRDEWDANLIRLAMYTAENSGYCTDGNKENTKKLVDQGVAAATELGMYVIVDWHVLREENPNVYKEEAKVFFEEMSSKYKDNVNVIYEICNEPNGSTSWSDVKSYAEEIVPVIRKNDKDAVIIIGTPNWSQDVDIASKDPVSGDNLMYAVHFYAATHTDNIRKKVKTALDNGLPVFVSEFSICDASGNGAIDYNQADEWFKLIDEKNLSYAAWNLSNKDETSSLIKSSCTKKSGWTDDDLSETGIWLKKQILNDK